MMTAPLVRCLCRQAAPDSAEGQAERQARLALVAVLDDLGASAAQHARVRAALAEWRTAYVLRLLRAIRDQEHAA